MASKRTASQNIRLTPRNWIRMRECLQLAKLIGLRTNDAMIGRAITLMRHDLQRVCRAKGIDWKAALEASKKRDSTTTGMPELPDKSPMIDE